MACYTRLANPMTLKPTTAITGTTMQVFPISSMLRLSILMNALIVVASSCFILTVRTPPDITATLARWLPLMAPGGLLVLHGVNARPTLWLSCQRHGQSFLFPADEGLGIVRMPGDPDPATAARTPLLGLLTSTNDAQQDQLRKLYEHVAAHVMLRSGNQPNNN